MCGIIVDMTIINILIRNYLPKLIPILENKNENFGDYVGNNFINVNLINLFTNDYINENTSLLIWDLLLIDGNIILIKSFLAIYHYLQPFLLKSNQTIEDFQTIINNNMKKLENDDKDLIFYLVIKEYNFNEEGIEQARFSLSVNTANSINKEKNNNYKIKKKSIDCNTDWPVCRYIYQNNEYKNNIIFFHVLQRKNKNYIENYFVERLKDKKKNINNENKNNHDIDVLIERKVHICNKNIFINDEMHNDKSKENNIDESNIKINEESKEEINYKKIIKKPEFIEASKKVLNNLQIKEKPNKGNENLNKNK